MNLPTIILLFSFLFATFLIHQNYGERRFEIFMNSYNCSVSPEYVLAPVCYLNKTFDPARAYLHIQIQRTIKTMKYSWILYLIRKKPYKRHRVLNVRNMNGCQFLDGTSVIPFLNIFRKIMLTYGTMPEKCPLEKGQGYFFDDLVIDSEKFPPYMPENQFVITVNVSMGKIFLYAVTADGKVMQKFNIYK